MKNIKLILSFCLLLFITFSCIKKKETNTQGVKGVATSTTALTPTQQEKRKRANQTRKLTPEQIEQQKARQARLKAKQKKGLTVEQKEEHQKAIATWKAEQKEKRQKAIAVWKAKKRTSNKAKVKVVNRVDKSELQAFKTQLNKPVTLDKNKGKFLEAATEIIGLSAQNTSDLDKLIKTYQRKGMDLRFFGAFYENNSKPFSKELSKIFAPLQVEQFKHFHAYWFDRISYPKPDMPASLYYRLKLTKDQFKKVVYEYSNGVLLLKNSANASAAQQLKAKETYRDKIAKILNSTQKDTYKKILTVSF